MTTTEKHFPNVNVPFQSSVVFGATKRLEDDHHLDEGRYRSGRDYPLDDFAYLEIAEVEENAHNAAYYDAAEALDMR